MPASAQECGPITYPGMDVVVDDKGVRAPGYVFKNECEKPGPWQAKWIRAAAEPAPAVAMVRREILLKDKPLRASAWMSADTKYRLYINGKLVSRGPVDIGRDYAGGSTNRWFYDQRDLAAYFQKGKNVIAVEVFRLWQDGFAVSRGQAGFLFEAALAMSDSTQTVVKTDASWRGTAAAQWPDAATFDAGKEPGGWRATGFADEKWPACVEVKDIWSPLLPSEIPPLMEARYPVKAVDEFKGGVKKQGADITVSSDGSFRVVFDRVLSGYPVLKIKGGKGATVMIKAHRQATLILGKGEQCFEFPFMTEIAPSFTVELKNVTAPLKIIDAGAVFTSQPLEYRGSFACSDEGMNRLWDVSRWTVQICLQTHHLDSPNHQEPISDPGDYLIEAMANYYAFGQPWLARQDIRKFAWLLKDEKYRNFHTSYSIGWLQMLMDYFDYTGDQALVQEMAPYAHELLATYASWRGRNGLVSEAPNYMFMDWVTIGGFGCHHPPAVIGQGYMTAFYYHGLAMASRVAELTGDSRLVEQYEKLRRETSRAFKRELWVERKGRYRDGKPFETKVKPYEWLPADKDIETFSPHVSLLAVLYDIVPKDRQAAVMETVLAEKPLNTQPWFMHWVFQAVDHAGLFDRYGTELMRRWQVVEETRSFREMWDNGDLSHGWCSSPLIQMSARILGVTPVEPDFKTMEIRPRICDLTWARGLVPTPHGDVEVSWKMADGRFELEAAVPEGTEADIVLPTTRFENAKVWLDNKEAAEKIHVKAGTHRFTVKGRLRPHVDG